MKDSMKVPVARSQAVRRVLSVETVAVLLLRVLKKSVLTQNVHLINSTTKLSANVHKSYSALCIANTH